MNRLYEFIINPNDLSNAGIASSFIKNTLKSLNVSREIIRRVAIATYEAEVNVVIHSYGGKCNFIITDNNLDVTFIDYGPGIESIEESMLEGTSTASKFAIENGFGAGMGLPNMKRVSDHFSITSRKEGTIITMQFRLGGDVK